MSVPKSERSESEAEFLYTARQLQIHSIQKCMGFPKRYTFFIGQSIAKGATRIHELVKCGNSIYPQNQHEVQMRRDYFMRANAELHSLVSQVEVAKELFGIEAPKMQEWTGMIKKEISLVKGVLESDRKRYKNLP